MVCKSDKDKYTEQPGRRDGGPGMADNEGMKVRLLLFAALGIALFAGDPWKGRDFRQWSDEDVQRMLKDSPWAREVMATVDPKEAKRESKDGGNGISVGAPADPANGGMPGGPGRPPVGGVSGPLAAPDSVAAGMPTMHLVVRWESALPVKEAMLRLKFGDKLPAADDPGYTLDREEKYYIVAVVGLEMPKGGRDSEASARMRDELLGTAKLTAKGRAAVFAEEVKVNPPEAREEVLFYFPRTPAIVASDKSVVFESQLGAFEIRKAFKPKEMVYQGKLEM